MGLNPEGTKLGDVVICTNLIITELQKIGLLGTANVHRRSLSNK